MEEACATCSKSCTKSCSNCKKAFYCSVKCQKGHRSTHRINCFPAKQQFSKTCTGDGNYLVATRDIEPGEEIIQELPIFIGPTYHPLGTTCLGCCKILFERENSKCLQCNWPLCQVDCEMVAEHTKNECGLFKSHGVKFYDLKCEVVYDIIIVIRLLLLRFNDPMKWQTLMSLPFRLKGKEDDKKRNFLVQIIRKLKPFENYENDVIRKVLDIEISNLLLLRSTPSDKSQTLIYNNAQKLSQHCIPNTMSFDSKHSWLSVIVVATVAIKKGELLKKGHSVTSMDGTSQRREVLLKDGIDCKCERCVDPTELGTFLSAIKCPSCTSYILPLNPLDANSNWTCKNCNKTKTAEEVRKLLQNITKEEEKLNRIADQTGFNSFFIMRNFSRADLVFMSKIEKFIEKWEPFFHPNHHLLFKVKTLFASGHHSLLIMPRSDSTSVEVREQRLKLIEKFMDLVLYILKVVDVISPGVNLFRGKILYLLASSEYFKCQEYLYCGGEVSMITRLYKDATKKAEIIRKIVQNMPDHSCEEFMIYLLDARKEAILEMASMNVVVGRDFERLGFF